MNLPREPRAGWQLTLALPVTGGLLAALVALLGGGIGAVAVAAVGSLLATVGAWLADPRWGWAGLAVLLLASAGARLVPVVGVGIPLWLVVGGPLFVAVAVMVIHLDPEPGVRPSPPSRGYLLRFGGLALLAAAIVAVPVLFRPVRLAFASEMGTTLAILLLAGAGLLLFAPPILATDGHVETRTADELSPGDVQFSVLQRRYRP